MYRAIAHIAEIVNILFHIVFVHVVMALVFTPDMNPLWGIPFALVYALFIGVTMGIIYYYILPEKSRKYWED